MPLRKKVTRTLVQRQAVQDIVHRVRLDSVSVQELEQIGVRLHGAGLWPSKPFFGPSEKRRTRSSSPAMPTSSTSSKRRNWLSPLMGIALRRRDLPEQGRAALLNALQEPGVDVEDPPFNSLMPANPRRRCEHGLSGDEPDDDALVSFLDDFLGYPTECSSRH